jgi:hypothetical protein
MKIKEIDTEKKQITIDTTINIGDLVHELKNLFKDNWKEWDINVEPIVSNYYPLYDPNPPYNPLLHNQPYYYGDFFNTTNLDLNKKSEELFFTFFII